MAETCPKCGYPQVETDQCPRCRVVVSQYRAYLQRVGQAPAGPTAPVIAPPPTAPTPAVPPSPPAGGIWPEGSPAGFWVRGAALVVDGLVFAGVLLPFVLFIILPTLLAGGFRRPDPAYFMPVFGGYVVVALAVQWGYTVWMHGKWGQTLGKMATGVKVVRVGGDPIGYGRAIVRYVFPFLVGYTPSLSNFFGAPRIIRIPLSIFSVVLGVVNYLIAGLRSDKRALHDLVAGTRVMKVPRPRLEGRPAGFWMRFAARVVDWQLLSLLVIVPFGIFFAVALPAMLVGKTRESTMGAAFMAVGIFFFLFTIVYDIWTTGKWGMTLGKRALGMNIVRVDGSPFGYGRATLRWAAAVLLPLVGFTLLASALAMILPGVLRVAAIILLAVVVLMSYFMAGFRSDKRALHDFIAGSRVTYIR